jgi:penicillin-binding protein-related factor A (putative recombinase)
MAQTPEGRVKKMIKDLMIEYGCYYHMPVQNGMGKPTLDFVGCYQGHFFGIEAKAPGKKPTPRQLATIREMEDALGRVFVIDGSKSLLEFQYWMDGSSPLV